MAGREGDADATEGAEEEAWSEGLESETAEGAAEEEVCPPRATAGLGRSSISVVDSSKCWRVTMPEFLARPMTSLEGK